MKLKNEIDFIYEYSDLNTLQTRAEVLKGKYKGLIVEFGNSCLIHSGDLKQNSFSFDFTFYRMPFQHKDSKSIKVDLKMQRFLSDLIAAIVDARRYNKREHEELMQAASALGVLNSKIKIDRSFYGKLDK